MPDLAPQRMDRPPHDILRDPAVAAHASSARPAWLFASDGSSLIFANAAGAALLGLAHRRDAGGFEVPRELAARIARSAATLRPDGHPRLERLRGLGTGFGQPLTCTCACLQRDEGPAILVAATETAGPVPTLVERARYLIEGDGIEGHKAVAAFGPDGSLLHATADALRHIDNAASPGGLDSLDDGIATLKIGSGADAIVLALFPANSQPITSEPAGASVTAQQDLLDLSPIAEAITAMTREPPPRNVPSDDRRPSAEHRHPLRFVWETDAENRFTISGEAFIALAGARTSNLLGRFWGEISAKLALDPDGRVSNALVSRSTWSSIDVNWPTANDTTVPVTLSAIPVFDRARVFRGYRGLGVWQGTPADDIDTVQSTAASRPQPSDAAPAEPREMTATAGEIPGDVAQQPHDSPAQDDKTFDHDAVFDRDTVVTHEADDVPLHAREATGDDKSDPHEYDAVPVADLPPHPENVVPFPAAFSDPKSGGLNPAERSAFRDLASRLSTRLKGADELARGLVEKDDSLDDMPYIPPLPAAALQAPVPVQAEAFLELVPDEADDLAIQRPVLEQLPLGVLIYRGAHLLYANPAFLKLAGQDSLAGFADAGGLDSMLVELDGANDDGGQRLRIAAADDRPALEGRLVTAPVAGEAAMVLTLQPAASAPRAATDATEAPELAALLDLASDGVVTLDNDARIVTANARAEMLFGYDAGALIGKPFGELFAPDSERIAKSRIDRLARGDVISDDDNGEIIGRRRQGGLISLQLTLGRANVAGTRFHALFRDMTRWKEAQTDMALARQQAEKASAAKSEFLAKISHEMRTPLNAIIGFSEMMMEERFGPVGNERYRDYLKDINTSGAHVVSLLNDLLDLSKIEAGKMELSFERVDLNEVTQQSVAIMQTQASRARVIVRTALSMNIPGIVADTRSIRQIVLNLLSNSIKFTGAGGQVIVSTAANDDGHVTLRVRDTGIGMSEKDIETALQPFRQLATSSRVNATGTGLGLPLTKALVEANRAQFSIKSATNAGTLVEIAFPAARALAQ